MIEVYEKDELTIDIIKKIKDAKNKNGEKNKDAIYILNELVRVLNEKGIAVTLEDLLDTKILKGKKEISKGHEANGKKVSKKRVIKRAVLPACDKIAIIEQITDKELEGKYYTSSRTISVFEEDDLKNEGIYNEDGEISMPSFKRYVKRVESSRKKLNRGL